MRHFFRFSTLTLLLATYTLLAFGVFSSALSTSSSIAESCPDHRKFVDNFLLNSKESEVKAFTVGDTEIDSDSVFQQFVVIRNNATVTLRSAGFSFSKFIAIFNHGQLIVENNTRIAFDSDANTGNPLLDKTAIFLFDNSKMELQGKSTDWVVNTTNIRSHGFAQGHDIRLCGSSALSVSKGVSLDFVGHKKSTHALQKFISMESSSVRLSDLGFKTESKSRISQLLLAIRQGDQSEVLLEADKQHQGLQHILDYKLPSGSTNKDTPFTAYPIDPANDSPISFEYVADNNKANFKTNVGANIAVIAATVELSTHNNLTLSPGLTNVNVFCNFDAESKPSNLTLAPHGILSGKSVNLGDRKITVASSEDKKQNVATVSSWDLKLVDVMDSVTVKNSEFCSVHVKNSTVEFIDSQVVVNQLHYNVDQLLTDKAQISMSNSSVIFNGDSLVSANIQVESSSLTLSESVRFCQPAENGTNPVVETPYQITAYQNSFVEVFSTETGCKNSDQAVQVDAQNSFILQQLIPVPSENALNSSSIVNITGIANVFAAKIDQQNVTLNFTFWNSKALADELTDMHSSRNLSTISTPRNLTFDKFDLLYTPDQRLLCGNWSINATLSGILPFTIPHTVDKEFEAIVGLEFQKSRPNCRLYKRGMAFTIVGILVGATFIVAVVSISAAFLYHRFKLKQGGYEAI